MGRVSDPQKPVPPKLIFITFFLVLRYQVS